MANVVRSQNRSTGDGDKLVIEWSWSECVKKFGLTEEHYVGVARPLGNYSPVEDFRDYEDVYVELLEPEAAVNNSKPGWYRAPKPKEALKTLADLGKAPNFDH